MAVRSALVEVSVLGPVQLVDRGTVVRLPRAVRTLLAALVARAGVRVSTDTLVEALWAEDPPPSARKSLQVHVVRLRHAIGASAIVKVDGGYRLDRKLIEIDAERVTAVIGEARAAIRCGEFKAAADLLADVNSAFRGEPYEDVPDCAVPPGELQRLEELRLAISEESAEAELGCGRGSECVGELERFVQAHPYRERAWGLLMRALYQAGRPADALGAYGRARIVLAAELGIEPGPALREVEQAILTHDRQLLATPSMATLGTSNLPAPLTPIIGRGLEIAALNPLDLAERLVTLVGVGGIGKTRLSIEIALQTMERSAFGPYFVDLAPIGAVELVPAALAAALGVDVEPGGDAIRRSSSTQQRAGCRRSGQL
jgi:DNA-binding SARP family transcriptional activator